MATKCNKNGQQQNGKNSAELQTEWTKVTWKAFGESARRVRNRSIEIQQVDDDDDNNYYYYYQYIVIAHDIEKYIKNNLRILIHVLVSVSGSVLTIVWVFC